MIHKLPSPDPGHVRVAFELPSALWADRIFVVGEFNDWDEQATRLCQARDGVWRATLDLPAGRQYQFRYLVDGQWKSDYYADGFAQGGYGEANSMVYTVYRSPFSKWKACWCRKFDPFVRHGRKREGGPSYLLTTCAQ